MTIRNGTARTALGTCLLMSVSLACSSPSPSSALGDYPAGPYGVNEGEVIENLKLFTLDGKPYELKSVYRGSARAVVLYATATWCFSCKQEVDWLNQKVASSGGAILPIAVVLENGRFQRADAATGREWVAGYGVQFLTLIDPEGQLDKYRESGVIPLNLIIDPSTMRISHREFSFNASSLDAALTGLLSRGGS